MPDPVTVRMVERNRGLGHVRVQVYIGRTYGSRQNAGTLVIPTDEWDELVQTFKLGPEENEALDEYIDSDGELIKHGLTESDLSLIDSLVTMSMRIELLDKDPWDSEAARRLETGE